MTPAFQAGGAAKITATRAAGHDPTTTPEAQRRRAATASKRRKAAVAWRDDGSLDRADVRRDILPKFAKPAGARDFRSDGCEHLARFEGTQPATRTA